MIAHQTSFENTCANSNIAGMKKFGLIKMGAKSTKKKAAVLKPSVFGMGGEDSDDGGDQGTSETNAKPMVAIVDYSKQDASAIEDYSFEPAQKPDPREAAAAAASVRHNASTEPEPEPQASYIAGMKAKAEVRSKERERASDKRIIKEREKEDELYGDQPKFITSAYKAKLIEDARFDEDEKAREVKDEGRTHATQGMQGFYSGLMKGNVSTGAAKKEEPQSQPQAQPEANTGGDEAMRAQAEQAERKRKLFGGSGSTNASSSTTTAAESDPMNTANADNSAAVAAKKAKQAEDYVQEKRALRMVEVHAARERYLLRSRGI